MTVLVVLTVLVILLLIAGLAFYLFWVGTLLTRIAGNLEGASDIVATIVGHAKLIGPGVEHINRTGGVVAGALPLLYGMAEEIVTDVTPAPEPPPVPSRPARLRPAPVPAARRGGLHAARVVRCGGVSGTGAAGGPVPGGQVLPGPPIHSSRQAWSYCWALQPGW